VYDDWIAALFDNVRPKLQCRNRSAQDGEAGLCSKLGDIQNLLEETGSNSAIHAASLAGRCISFFQHLAREKSLVPKCSEITRNSPHISKGVFENDICEFESSRPSQPVSSLSAMSDP
jgi:hypothetical protein